MNEKFFNKIAKMLKPIIDESGFDPTVNTLIFSLDGEMEGKSFVLGNLNDTWIIDVLDREHNPIDHLDLHIPSTSDCVKFIAGATYATIMRYVRPQ